MAMHSINKVSDFKFLLVIEYNDVATKERRQSSFGVLQQSVPVPAVQPPPTQIPVITTATSTCTRDDLFDLRKYTVEDIPAPDIRVMITDLVKTTEKRGRALFTQKDKVPAWWPADIPWALKSDPRSSSERKPCWTHELKRALVACYNHYHCLDLLSGKSESHYV
jgi:hypothetical protein